MSAGKQPALALMNNSINDICLLLQPITVQIKVYEGSGYSKTIKTPWIDLNLAPYFLLLSSLRSVL